MKPEAAYNLNKSESRVLKKILLFHAKMQLNASSYFVAERFEEVKQWNSRALQQASNLSMHPLAAHCHEGLARVYRHLRNKEDAQVENEMAFEIYSSLGMTYWLKS